LIIDCLLGHVTARSAFNDLRLIEELSESLRANGLLQKSELKGFKSLRKLVGVFAVANMHLCVIDLGDGMTAETEAGATKTEGLAFFDTSISVIEYADPDLHPESDQTPNWPFHIELAASGKLKKLV
jgi:hypothetical protein